MIKSTFFLTSVFLFLFYNQAFTQKDTSIFIIHPVIGEIIDQEEKATFALFPEIPVNEFVAGQVIRLPDSTLIFRAILQNDTIISRKANMVEINEYQHNIEKILDCMKSKNNDTINQKNIKLFYQVMNRKPNLQDSINDKSSLIVKKNFNLSNYKEDFNSGPSIKSLNDPFFQQEKKQTRENYNIINNRR